MEPNRTVAQKAIVGANKDGRSSRVNDKMQRGRKKERERELCMVRICYLGRQAPLA